MYNLVVLVQQGHALPLSFHNLFNVSQHDKEDVVLEKILKRCFFLNFFYFFKIDESRMAVNTIWVMQGCRIYFVIIMMMIICFYCFCQKLNEDIKYTSLVA